MATRATVFETLQLGLEATPGTAVPCNRRLQAIDLDMEPDIPTHPVESAGYKASVDLISEKEYTKVSAKGMLAFNDLLYLLSSVFCVSGSPNPTALADAGGVWIVALGAPTAGTFTLSFNGSTTTGIAYNCVATDVQTALEALTSIGANNVQVTGSGGGVGGGHAPFTVTFTGDLEDTATPLTGSGTGLTGGTFSVTAGSTATITYRWWFTPNVTGPDTIQTYTMQKGSSIDASQISYVAVDSLDLDFGQKGCEMKATMFGQAISDGVSMTASPTYVPIHAVSPNSIDVFVGTSINNMALLPACYKASFGIKSRQKPVFRLRTDEQSYGGTVETKWGLSAQIVVEENTAEDAYLTDLRQHAMMYGRIEATGAQTEPGFFRKIVLTFPFKFSGTKRGDNEGVYAGTYDLEPIYDASGVGYAVRAMIDTDYAAL